MKKNILIIALILFLNTLFSKNININSFDIKWGDSPLSNGEFSYTKSDDGWKPFNYTGNSIQNKEDNFLWIRYKLPNKNLNGDGFFFSSVIGFLEIYCNNELVYRMINLNTLDKNKYYGFPTALIPLKESYRNKYLYIRIYSDKKDIGFIGDLIIDNALKLYKKEKMHNIDFLFLGVFFWGLGLLMLPFSLFLKSKDKRSIISLAIFMISSGIWCFEHPSVAFLTFLPPNIWVEFFEYSIITLPIGMIMFYEAIFKDHYKKATKTMWNLNLIYVIIIAFLDLINKFIVKSPINILFYTRSIFYIIFLIEVIIILYISFRETFFGNKEAKLYTVGVLAIILSSFYEILGERRMLPFWKRPLMQWGMFVFIILIVKIIFSAHEKEKEMLSKYSKELQEKNFLLKKENEIKLNFIAKMSHELKTPLNGIIGFSKMLLDENLGKLTEKQYQILKTIYTSGKQMNSIVDETMVFSRLKREKITLTLQKIQMHYLIERIINTNKLNLKKDIEIINLVDKNCLVTGDEVRVYQIVNNLLNNAIKFTNKGKIKIGSIEKKDFYEIYVEDNGPGIAEEYKDEVFNEFKQLKNTNLGLGLGLAIVKKLVEMHGGTINVENTENGAKFIFTLKK